MIMCGLMLVCVFLRPVRDQVHFDHDPFTELYADVSAEHPPHFGTEGPFAGNVSVFLYDQPETLHDLLFFCPFPCPLSVFVFHPVDPGKVSGFRTAEDLKALFQIVSAILLLFLLIEAVYQRELVFFYLFRFDDDKLAAYSERNFFLTS